MTDLEIAKRIAELTEAAGGRVYFVGGFVRDKLMAQMAGCKPEGEGGFADVDIEVHGVTPEVLRGILGRLGEVLQYGSSFGIYGLAGSGIDIAMPRKERAVAYEAGPDGSPDEHARGHRDFEISVDPFIGTREAARRRDFTINALMQDVLTGEIVDHFGGQADLAAGIIRHVDDASFAEDPLRVLRAAQFAARFQTVQDGADRVPVKDGADRVPVQDGADRQPRNFTVAPKTIELCRGMDLSALTRERVEGELKKALVSGVRPSVFFETLRAMDQLSFWFPELEQLIGLEQDPVYHPEGDVWVHTMQALDRAAVFRDAKSGSGANAKMEVSEPYRFMLLVLLHDLGKTVTTEVVNGRIHAYGHETEGLPLTESFLRRITGEEAVIKYVLNMAPLHMKPNMKSFSRSSVKSTNHMFDEAAVPKDLIYMAMADKPVMSGDVPFEGDSAFLFERLKVYEETMARPYVTGKDLIEAGLEPGEYFGELLAYAHKLRLAGIDKKTALKQVLSYDPDRKRHS